VAGERSSPLRRRTVSVCNRREERIICYVTDRRGRRSLQRWIVTACNRREESINLLLTPHPPQAVPLPPPGKAMFIPFCFVIERDKARFALWRASRGVAYRYATNSVLPLPVIKRFGRTKAPSGRELSPKVTEGARARRGVVLYCYTRRLLPPHPWSPSLPPGKATPARMIMINFPTNRPEREVGAHRRQMGGLSLFHLVPQADRRGRRSLQSKFVLVCNRKGQGAHRYVAGERSSPLRQYVVAVMHREIKNKN